MISFFRRALSSWLVLGLLALVLVAFIITGVNTPSGPGGSGGSGAKIAKAGGTSINETDLLRRVQGQFDAARREQPGLDARAFVAGGGFEGVTDALISARALESWGKKYGFAIGKRLIDAEVAGFPAFRGVTGQFDETAMREALSRARVSEKEMRGDIASDLIRSQILAPVAAGIPMPAAVARPYATLLLEQRSGMVGIIPLAAVADMRTPTDPEINAAYKTNIAAYTRPEARVLRYALFGIAQVSDQAKPTEAEIAAYYQDNGASYAAKEMRGLTQLIAPTEAAARDIAAAAKAGTLAAAAAKAGLEPATLATQLRDSYAKATSDAIAAAAFSAPRGGIVGPIKGAFGWYVVRVDAITGTPARSLEQARPEIVALLTRQKTQDALSELGGKIEDATADGASFAETTANNKLTVVETPPVLADGQAVDLPGWKAPPELAALLKTGFEASADDRPTVETIVKDEQFALMNVARIIPPTPLPLAQVRELVIRDIIIKRTRDRAKALGTRVAAAVNKGVPLAKALADTGVKLPPAQPARARQLDLAQAPQGTGIPAPVRTLFTLRKGQAKLVAADNGSAFFVTVLDTITPGNLATAPGLLDSTRSELSRASSSEIGEQFVRAAEKDIGVRRYPDAIAAVKRQFAGGQ